MNSIFAIGLVILASSKLYAANGIIPFEHMSSALSYHRHIKDLTYFGGWNCFDPYGLSGLDKANLRAVRASPILEQIESVADGCLDVSKINEISSPTEFNGPGYYSGKSSIDPMQAYRDVGVSDAFYRLGKKLCVGVTCRDFNCENSFQGNDGLLCLNADTGIGKWTIGDYSGYIAFVKPSELFRSSIARPIPLSFLQGEKERKLKGDFFTDSCPTPFFWVSKSVCKYDQYYPYSLDSLGYVVDSANQTTISKIVLEISDGRKINIKQNYFNISVASNSLEKSARIIYVDPLRGGGAYRWHDLQGDRVVVVNKVGIDGKPFNKSYIEGVIYRLLAPQKVQDSLCFFYQINSVALSQDSEREPKTICIDKCQNFVRRKFRNLQLIIRKF